MFKYFFSVALCIVICLNSCIDKRSLDPKYWPPITLVGTLNVEKEVYKLGDTLVFSFIVPDSLPSLTTLGEKVKIHSLSEASLLFNFKEIDTVKKSNFPLNTSIPINATNGNIQIRNDTYFIGDFNVINKPFGLQFKIILNKKGLFSIQNGDIRKFVANDGYYKAGLFFNLNTKSQNFHLIAKHLPHVTEGDPKFSFSYSFYVQ